MIKRKISEKKRTIGLWLLIFLMLLSLFALVAFGIIGLETERPLKSSEYTTRLEIKHKPNLREDPFYNEELIAFGSGYVTKFIDSIDLSFLYDFLSSDAKDLNGSYTATALLEATYNEKNLIWTKEYELIPTTEFTSSHAEQLVVLPLQECINLAKSIQANTAVTSSVKMTVLFKAEMSTLINGEKVNDKSEASLEFPITNDVLVTEGTPLNEQTKTVESLVSQPLLPKKAMLSVGIILFVLSCGAYCLLYFFTEGIKADYSELRLKRIFKKYNGRIIECEKSIKADELEAVQLKSFRDLLLVADELKKPIFMNKSTCAIDTEFYVFDNPDAYLFRAELLKAEERDLSESYFG